MWKESLVGKVKSWCFQGSRRNLIKVQYPGWAPEEKFPSGRAVPKKDDDPVQQVVVDDRYLDRQVPQAAGDMNNTPKPRRSQSGWWVRLHVNHPRDCAEMDTWSKCYRNKQQRERNWFGAGNETARISNIICGANAKTKRWPLIQNLGK